MRWMYALLSVTFAGLAAGLAWVAGGPAMGPVPAGAVALAVAGGPVAVRHYRAGRAGRPAELAATVRAVGRLVGVWGLVL